MTTADPPPGVHALRASLSAGETTVAAVVEGCLTRIHAAEPVVRSWAHLDAEGALERARSLDALPAGDRGALHGIPLGIKDVFDTYDLPTEYGSPIYAGHRPAADAAVVALARRAGMVPLGKLVTTEFAAWPPGPTTNPHDPTRTPGGSSSGSAAAVAAGMIPVAFATQTTGSIVRPAAFCGVVGYKPTHGTLPTAGVLAISESFDTVGVITRAVRDAALVVGTLAGRWLEVPDAPRPPRLGVCLTHEWPAALPETRALFDVLPGALDRAGASVTSVELPDAFAGLAAAQGTVWAYEMARCLADELRRFRSAIREPLGAMLDEGAALPAAEYDRALELVGACRALAASVCAGYDALVVPAAPGVAPALATTGDPIFNRIWSAVGGPAIAIPVAVARGLPLGVQLIGPPGADPAVLTAAAWIEQVLREGPLPAVGAGAGRPGAADV